MRPLLSRSFRRTFLRPKPLFITLLLLFTLDTLLITHRFPVPQRTATLPSSLRNQKIFIASMARNSEYMLRLYWNSALLRLVQSLGPSNVYVSILESGSQEDTKGALRELGEKLNELGVENKIVLGIDAEEQAQTLMDVPEEGKREGWIFTARGEKGWELRRIPYLAELRNRVMGPMFEEAEETMFDRVLWINDVVFTTEDVTTLLSTRDGNYAAACSLDFSSNRETYYDTFALRDINGAKTATLTYPFFHHTRSISQLNHLQPIPVKSCWNGMIAFDAKPFYPAPPSTPKQVTKTNYNVNPTVANPKIKNQPLKFRGISDSLAKMHLEGSECCLIHSDNPLSRDKGVFLNPNVRVAYNATTYSAINHGIEVLADVGGQIDGIPGGDGRPWPGKGEKFRGVWGNRVARWTGWVKMWSEGKVVRGRVDKWAKEGKKVKAGAGKIGVGTLRGLDVEERTEEGVECLVNEMQVMFDNGWQHV